MNTFFRLVIGVLLLVANTVAAQNLVPNGSFEEYIDCPTALDMLGTHCEGWFSSRGTCDYFHACKSTWGVSVPGNLLGYQEALSGMAYAGLSVFQTASSNYREHISIQLLEPLELGVHYYISFYASLSYNGANINKASNGHGAYFTTVEHSSNWDQNPENNPSPLRLDGVILNDSILADTTNWVQLKGSFIADSAYTYIVIGGMYTDIQADTLDLGMNDLTGEAYYYIDEVRVSSDSIFAHEDITSIREVESLLNLTIFPNPTSGKCEIDTPIPFDSLELYSMTGQLVFRKSGVEFLDLSNFESGLYFIQVHYPGGRKITKKVMKIE